MQTDANFNDRRSPCNNLGVCEFLSTPVYEGCCRQNSDCPHPVFVFGDTDDQDGTVADTFYNRRCGFYECISGGKCFWTHREACCRDNSNCDQTLPRIPFVASQYMCSNVAPFDFSGTDRACALEFTSAGVCTTDADCGGDGIANGCARGTCVANRCQMQPRNPATVGCCDSTTAESSCTLADKCRKFRRCDSAIQNIGDYLIDGSLFVRETLPTFQCEYFDYKPQGCCNANADCEELADRGACVARSCNLFTNQCNPPDPSTNRCAAFSAECGIRNISNLCEFSFVQKNTLLGDVSNVFLCQGTMPISGCDPASPPPLGLAPAVDFALVRPPLGCDFECGTQDQNTVGFIVSMKIPTTSAPLYNFTLELSVLTDAPANTVTDLEPVIIALDRSSPEYENRDQTRILRSVGVDQFAVTTAAVSFFSASLASKTPLYPGENLSLFFRAYFNATVSQSSIQVTATLKKFEPCVPFYFGQSGCSATLHAAGGLIARDEQVVPPIDFFLDGVQCSTQCFDVPTSAATTTTTTATTAPPTPKPTPMTFPAGPPPVPAPLPLPSYRQATATVAVEASLLDCSWDCADNFDGTVNRLLFKLSITPKNGPMQAPTSYAALALLDRATRVDTYVHISDNNRSPPIQGLNPDDPATAGPLTFLGTFNTDGTLFLRDEELLDVYVSVMIRPTSVLPPFTNMSVFILPLLENYPCDSFVNETEGCTPGSIVDFQFPALIEIPWASLQCSLPCPALPLSPPVFVNNSLQSVDCTWQCTDEDANLVTASGCVETRKQTRFATPDMRLDGFVLSTTGGVTFLGKTTIEVAGQILEPSGRFPQGSLESIVFRMQQPIIIGTNSTPVCWSAKVRINDPRFFFSVRAFAISRCSILERFAETCSTAVGTAGVPISQAYSGTLSITDSVNNIFASAASQPGDTGGMIPLFNELVDTNIGDVIFDSFENPDCSEVCDFVVIPPGFIGGIAFFDGDGDGTFTTGSTDQVFPGLPVGVFTAASPNALTSTVTNAFGVYLFNRSALFTPGVTSVFLRTEIPGGDNLVSRAGDSGNRDLDNIFVADPAVQGSARTPFSITLTTPTAEAYSFGYQDRSTSCTPALGPLAGNNKFTLGVQLVQCAESLPTQGVDDDDDYCKQICDETFGATHRVFDFLYRLDNTRSPAVKHASAVITEMESNLCVQAIPLRGTDGVTFLSRQSYSQKKRAAAHYSFETMLPGTERHFVGRWSTCTAPLSPLRYNNTISLFEDPCAEVVRDWRTCKNTTFDSSGCYNEVVVLGSACSSGAAPPATVLRDTDLTVTTRIAREADSCIVNRRIESFLCGAGTQLVCQSNPSGRAVVSANTTLSHPSTATGASERGVIEVTLERNMTTANACRSVFDPQIEIVRAGMPNAIVVTRTQGHQNNTVARVSLSFEPIPAGGAFTVLLRHLECGPSLQINYTLAATITTEKCTGGLECRNVTTYIGGASGLAQVTPCANASAAAFVLPNSRGPRIQDVDEFKSSNASNLQFWVVVIVTIVTLAVVCCLVMLLTRRRRKKSGQSNP